MVGSQKRNEIEILLVRGAVFRLARHVRQTTVSRFDGSTKGIFGVYMIFDSFDSFMNGYKEKVFGAIACQT